MTHCGTCGTSHETEKCPINTFVYIYCSCGNGFPAPADILGMPFGFCGKCNSEDKWKIRKVLIEDFKKHLPMRNE